MTISDSGFSAVFSILFSMPMTIFSFWPCIVSFHCRLFFCICKYTQYRNSILDFWACCNHIRTIAHDKRNRFTPKYRKRISGNSEGSMFSSETYSLLVYTVQWMIPPYSLFSSIRLFPSFIFCTFVLQWGSYVTALTIILCTWANVFHLCLLFLFPKCFYSVVLCTLTYVFGGPYLSFLRFYLCECFSFVCSYYNTASINVNIFLLKFLNFYKILQFSSFYLELCQCSSNSCVIR